jgi:hypothetical protein
MVLLDEEFDRGPLQFGRFSVCITLGPKSAGMMMLDSRIDGKFETILQQRVNVNVCAEAK